MRFKYDKQADALSIRFNEEPYQESDEVSEGVILDYDKSGRIIGMEILEASRKMPREFNSIYSGKTLSATFELARAGCVIDFDV